jgi:hypothetical protein
LVAELEASSTRARNAFDHEVDRIRSVLNKERAGNKAVNPSGDSGRS